MPEAPTLTDGVIALDAFIDEDVAAHAQVSYWVFPAHRRRGYACRIVRLACDYAFDRVGLQRVEAIVEPDNEASHGVLRRAGFTREGLLRKRARFGDEMRDMVMYSFLPEDR